MYEFSVPLLYTKNEIDFLAELNNNLSKSKIVTFYDSLPDNIDELSGLEQSRGINPSVRTADDFYDAVKYVKSKGFNFVYLLNSTRSMNKKQAEYPKITKNLNNIIERLRDLDCKSYRVGNTSVIQYLLERYPDVDIRTSTTLGYTSITQYKNLIKTYPQISEFCLHYDNNHDFKLLKNLVTSIPNVTKEVIVNELCIKGCPFRNSHYSYLYSNFINLCDREHHEYFINNCHHIFFENLWETICKSNIIYPWWIKSYEDIGITNFKIAGRGYGQDIDIVKYYANYLKSVESDILMMNMDFFSFFQNKSYACLNKNFLPKIKVRDVIEYLPDVNHFIQAGQLCDSICGMDCNYCFEKAKILNEKFPVKI